MRFLNFFRKNKPKKNYFLALDIGTEFVKTLVFKTDKDRSSDNKKIGLVIGKGRQRQAPNHMQAGAVADIEGVVATSRAAIEEACRMAGARPRKAIIGIAGELVKGSTTSFIYKRPEPKEEIDLVELKNIIQKIQWRAFETARRQLAEETGRKEIEIKLVNALITDIRIDGYRVTNPLDFCGREVYLSIFNVYAPLVNLGAIESIASKLNLDLLAIAAEPYAVAKSLNLDYSKGAIIIDIGGGSLLGGLKKKLKGNSSKNQWFSGLSFNEAPKVNFIRLKDIIDIVDKTNLLKEPEDIASAALASLTLKLTEEKGVLPSILRRTVRIMQRP